MVTYALSVWQPWASLLIEGIKPYEFRGRRSPLYLTGQRIVIHAAKPVPLAADLRETMDRLHKGRHDGMNIAPALDLLEAVWRRERMLPLGAALGTAVLGTPVRCTDLFPEDRDVDPGKWAWPLSDVRRWPEPVPISGKQGFWHWPHELQEGR